MTLTEAYIVNKFDYEYTIYTDGTGRGGCLR